MTANELAVRSAVAISPVAPLINAPLWSRGWPDVRTSLQLPCQGPRSPSTDGVERKRRLWETRYTGADRHSVPHDASSRVVWPLLDSRTCISGWPVHG